MYLTEPLPQQIISKLSGWPLALIVVAVLCCGTAIVLALLRHWG